MIAYMEGEFQSEQRSRNTRSLYDALELRAMDSHLDILVQNAWLELHVLVYSTNDQDLVVFRQCQNVGHCSIQHSLLSSWSSHHRQQIWLAACRLAREPTSNARPLFSDLCQQWWLHEHQALEVNVCILAVKCLCCKFEAVSLELQWPQVQTTVFAWCCCCMGTWVLAAKCTAPYAGMRL